MSSSSSSFSGHVDARFADDLGDPNAVTITIDLPDPVGAKTMRRAADEPLEKALTRLRATIDKAKRARNSKGISASSGGGDESAPPPTLAESAASDAPPVPPSTPNRDAWTDGRALVVDGRKYVVRVNAPLVAGARVAGLKRPAASYPLTAVADGCRFVRPDDLAWRWFRDDRVLVGEGWAYTPTDEDVGATLRVEATAPISGVRVASPPSGIVAAAPARPAARERLASLGEPRVDGVRVMTYNVLADAYSHTWSQLYPYLSPANADAEGRLPKAMEDVRLARPDVVCLQEVDAKWYDAFWVPQMRAAGYAPAGTLSEKTGLTREGVATFARADRWRVATSAVVSLTRPGPSPAESATEAWIRTQPALEEALGKVSTVGQIAVLEPVAAGGADGGRRRPIVVANAHLFFHPGATHLRVLQARWLLRHAETLRRAWGRDSGAGDDVGLIVCGDFNGEAHDGVVRYVADGTLRASHSDWALGGVFRWGGTSSRAAAKALLAVTTEGEAREEDEDEDAREEDEDEDAGDAEEEESERASSTREMNERQQRLGRMTACWRRVADAQRGIARACDADVSADVASPTIARLAVAQAHARAGCTFKTCEVVAAYTLRADARMTPGTSLDGLALAPFPRASTTEGKGTPPEWARGVDDALDAAGDDEGRPSPDALEVARAVLRELRAHEEGLARASSSAAEEEAAALSRLTAEQTATARGWLALPIGACSMHLTHPLSMTSACGYVEYTNFVRGFVGALDWVFVDGGDDDGGKGRRGGLRATNATAAPPLDALTAETALPNSEFPSDHIPMVADLEFASE